MSWKYKVTKNSISCGPLTAYVVLEKDYNRVLSNKGSHSPDGFQIGYGGSGPADLAYSILHDYFQRTEFPQSIDKQKLKQKVESFYQNFKNDFIVPAKKSLLVESGTIESWVNEQK